MSINSSTILVVEDDDIDFESVKRALKSQKIRNPVERAVDGFQAFEKLCNRDPSLKKNLPMLILLDLNMPRVGGLDFLNLLRDDPNLAHIPVVVLSTSTRNEDMQRAFEYGICDYVIKAILAEGLQKIFKETSFPLILDAAA